MLEESGSFGNHWLHHPVKAKGYAKEAEVPIKIMSRT